MKTPPKYTVLDQAIKLWPMLMLMGSFIWMSSYTINELRRLVDSNEKILAKIESYETRITTVETKLSEHLRQ